MAESGIGCDRLAGNYLIADLAKNDAILLALFGSGRSNFIFIACFAADVTGRSEFNVVP